MDGFGREGKEMEERNTLRSSISFPSHLHILAPASSIALPNIYGIAYISWPWGESPAQVQVMLVQPSG